MTAGPLAMINGSVNAITGNYSYSSIDYTLSGPDPYVLGRSYVNASDEMLNLGLGWSFYHPDSLQVHQPHGIGRSKDLESILIEEVTDAAILDSMRQFELDVMRGTFDYVASKEERYRGYEINPYTDITLTEPGGSKLFYRGDGSMRHFEPRVKNTGWTNTTRSTMSGGSNVKNVWIYLDEKNDRWLVRDGDGTIRTYTRKCHEKPMRPELGRIFYKYRDYLLCEERKPSGNRVLYRYGNDYRINKITTVNDSKEKTLGWVTFSHEKNGTAVKTSDGNTFFYEKEVNGDKSWVKKVVNPFLPNESLSYSSDKRLSKTIQDGSFLQTHYYNELPHKNKVFKQIAPAGLHGNAIDIYTLYYKDGDQPHTTVVNAKGYKTTYYYNKHKRLTKLERRSASGKLLSSECYKWGADDEDAGNLISRTLYDEHMKPVITRQYSYDDKHNIVKEKLKGVLTGKTEKEEGITLRYGYSNNRFNLKTEEEDAEGNKTYYRYKKETNLLTAKLICKDSKICKRQFFRYDDAGVLIEEINDDGSSPKRSDVSGITHRFITRIQPREELPRYGEPEVIEEFAYDPSTKKEHLLKKTVNSFTSKGLIKSTKVYDGTGSRVRRNYFTYDELGRCITTQNTLGHTIKYRYDEFGRVIYQKGPGKKCKTYSTYDVMGRLVKTRECYGDTEVTKHLRYDELGRKIASVDAQGNETLYKYDALDRVTQITLPSVSDETGALVSSVRRFDYENMGLTVKATDERGYETTTMFNIAGKPIKECLPDGSKKYYEYDLRGNLIKEVAPNGLVTKNKYDYQNRLIETTQKKADFCSTRKLTYNAFYLLKEESSTGEITSYSYDFKGRKTSVTVTSKDKSLQRRTRYRYDTQGRLIQEKIAVDDGFIAKNFEYDQLDRIISETCTDDKGIIYNSKSQCYDEVGNIIKVITFVDGHSSILKTNYHLKDVPSKITDALGNTTTITIDHCYPLASGQHGIKKTTCDPNGVITKEIINARGQTASITRFDPFGKKISSEKKYYDAAGNLIKIIEGIEKKVVTTFSYGPCNRLKTIRQAAGAPEEKVTRFYYNKFGERTSTLHANGSYSTCSYDEKGRLQRHQAPTFDYSFSYDNNDRVLKAVNHKNNRATIRIYDGLGQLVQETLETGLTISYSYDGIGRTKIITLPDASMIEYGYSPGALASVIRRDAKGLEQYRYTIENRDASGYIQKATLPDGSVINCSRDLLGRVTDLIHPRLIQKIDRYDAVGNIMSITTTDPLETKTDLFGYDALCQLTQENDHNYNYDSLYNRVSKDDSTYTVNSLHSLLAAGETTFTYDRAGNRLTKQQGQVLQVYEYDDLDRLTASSIDGARTTYCYDAFNRRVSLSTEEAVSNFIYLHENEVGLCNADGAIKELRLLGEGFGAEIGATVAIECLGTVYVPIHDHRGNIKIVTDLSGQITEWYRYSAFGEEEVFNEVNLPKIPFNPWRFSSKRVDGATGFVFFGLRYYDPEIGRWLTQDPLGLKAGPNLYAYVRNASLTHFDLYGLVEMAISNEAGSILGELKRALANYPLTFGDTSSNYVAPPVVNPSGIWPLEHINAEVGACPREVYKAASIMVHRNPHPENLVGPRKIVSFTNGIDNHPGCSIASMEAIVLQMDLNQIYEMWLDYNPTLDVVNDALRTFGYFGGIASEVTTNIRNRMNETAKRCIDDGAAFEFHNIAHSQGGAIMYDAVFGIGRGIQETTTLYMVGSATCGKEKCGEADVLNFNSASDWVPWIGSPIATLIGTLRGSINYYGSPFNFPCSQHAFNSQDYSRALEDITVKILNLNK